MSNEFAATTLAESVNRTCCKPSIRSCEYLEFLHRSTFRSLDKTTELRLGVPSAYGPSAVQSLASREEGFGRLLWQIP